MCESCDKRLVAFIKSEPTTMVAQTLAAMVDLVEYGDGQKAMRVMADLVTLSGREEQNWALGDVMCVTHHVDAHTPLLNDLQQAYKKRLLRQAVMVASNLLNK